ncbi:MAG: YdcF family protein [Candidatus Margulisiibacteriota bacterium]|nr:YdcF family protein [Candidatus Margulisiibacteriota bacterium]
MKNRFKGLIVLFLIVFAVYFSATFILEGIARFLVVQDKLELSDVIVVLAGDSNGERVAQGVELHKKGYAPKIIMSGGPIMWELAAADWMKKQAVAAGVPASAVLLQRKSESTMEDVLLSLPLIRKNKFRSVILVTSPYHSRRSKRTFKKGVAGLNIEVLSYPVQDSKFKVKGWWERHEDTQRVVWEYVSLVYYLFKGY